MDAVVDRWRGATHQERRAIERWVDAYGKSPWEKRFQEIENAMPPRPRCLRDMPRGWRDQYLIDVKSREGTEEDEMNLDDPNCLHEYIAARIVTEKHAIK